MTSAFLNEQALEKQIQRQMGCMAGFLQIFDRHQILTGKRLYSTKRLPPSSPSADSTSESEKSSPESPADSGKPPQLHRVAAPSPQKIPAESVTDFPTKSPLLIVELKQGTRRKLYKEAPRLSLDSRATTDAKGGLHPKEIRTTTSVVHNGGDSSTASGSIDGDQQHRSHSVIARLMGLEPFPNSSDSEPEKQPELRRSASESRVSKDLFQSRFTSDGSNFYPTQPTQSHSVPVNNATKDNAPIEAHFADPRNHSLKKATEALSRGRDYSASTWRAAQLRKNVFDSGDIFPEAKQTVSIYGEIEKRIKMRGIDEPSNDLETLKQILEALQLKGLLHPKPPSPQNQVRHRNFVYDESPIVLMKPSRCSATPISRRMGNDYPPSNGKTQVRGVRRNNSLAGENSPSVSPRRERHVRSPTRGGRGPSPMTRNSEGNVSSSRSNSPVKPRQLSVETQRRVNEPTEKRSRASPVHSPKRAVADPMVNNRSPRNKNPTSEIRQKEKIMSTFVTEDESSSTSGSSVTTSTESGRWKDDEYREGGNILARCDKLLHSIAEMAAADMQPSPVSVLDPSFDKDESLTPSPVTIKRNIDFKDQSGDLEEETWSPVISPIRTKCLDISDKSDFTYISDILRASQYQLPEESDVFLSLEKQQYLKGSDTSKVSSLQRKLIFDTINEIIDRYKQRPPWKAFPVPSLDKVWSDFQTIREPESAEDLFETICGVLKRDLAGDDGWGEFPVEKSEAVLEIERLIFKDVICEAMRDLTALPNRCTLLSSMRKLIF